MTNLTTRTPDPLTLAGADLRDAFAAFDAAAARWLATLKPKTMETYKPGLELYRTVAIEAGADPLKADALIIFNKSMQARRRDKGGELANDTIRIRMKPVARFFSWCWDFNLTPLKPGQTRDLLDLPPARKLSPRDVLTTDEARRILEATRGAHERCLMRIMLDAGLRVSEALGLRCGDVYAAGGRHYLYVRDAKGDDPREVDIQADLYRELAIIGGDLTDKTRAHVAIFDVSRYTAWRWVKRAARRSGVSKEKTITPHSLRHTHAHDLAMQGWPAELIGTRLGHKSIDTTKIYTRPADMLKQRAAPKMSWNDLT